MRNPEASSTSWLFILNCCPTRDRLLSRGLQTDHLCLLCKRAPESRDHLFFRCSYSYSVWRNLSLKLGLPATNTNWTYVIDGLLSITSNNHQTYLSRLAWQSSVYEIWMERSGRLHRNIYRPSSSLLKVIRCTIKSKISSLRPQNSTSASDCMQFWLSLG